MRWLFPSLHGYRRDWLRGDLLAGLTVWAVLVPEALAYASIAGAALTILALLALTGLFEDLPEATLAAVVIAAVIELVDYRALIELYRAHTERLGREFGFVARPDFIAALAALLGVTVFDTLPGLFIGIGVSLLLLIYRASRPYIATLGREPGPNGRYSDIDRHPDNELPSHIAVLRIESSLYFANGDSVRTRISHAAEADGITAIILDAETIPFIDVTAALEHFWPPRNPLQTAG